jgi:hypothetical protein
LVTLPCLGIIYDTWYDWLEKLFKRSFSLAALIDIEYYQLSETQYKYNFDMYQRCIYTSTDTLHIYISLELVNITFLHIQCPHLICHFVMLKIFDFQDRLFSNVM